MLSPTPGTSIQYVACIKTPLVTLGKVEVQELLLVQNNTKSLQQQKKLPVFFFPVPKPS